MTMPLEGLSSNPAICVVGSANFDQITRAPRLPGPGETVHGTSYQTGFGGKGANQAVMAARLGGIVSMVAKLGEDAIGEMTLAHFKEEGIDVRHVLRDSSTTSGVAPIWVDEHSGQNQIIVVPGANDALTPDEVHLAKETLLSADVVVCQNEIPMACNRQAFESAMEGEAIRIYNPAPAREIEAAFLELCQVIIPNQHEAALLTQQPTETDAGIRAAARQLQERGPRVVILTLGERGAYLLDGDEEHWIESDPVNAVDTTGAGDAFVGTLAFLMGRKTPITVAVRSACRLASLSVLRPGTQTSYPSRDDARSLL